MMQQTKVVLDGTIFSECEMRGANRDGMMRLTEDITKELLLKKDVDISFANTVYIAKYQDKLKRFVQNNYPDYTNKIFLKKIPSVTNILKWKDLFRTMLPGIMPNSMYKELNEYDVFHSFYYPFSSVMQKSKIKKSITFLDIIPLLLNGYPQPLVNRTKKIVDSTRDNYTISISEFSKQDLLNYDKRIDEKKVFVVPLAASKELFYQNKNKDDWQIVRQKYNLPENYFLSVAGNDSRKNISTVIKSFTKLLLQEGIKDLHLLLTGNGSHNYQMLEELNIPQNVRAKIFIPVTFIDSKDLAVLYSNAVCFFFMSLYEGFGLPALEAMQCGTPVVVSNTTSLPEVVGDAALTIDPTDVDALCSAMLLVYDSTDLRNHYATASLQRAKQFSWSRCADEYATIFKQIALL
jgi:glycosyltransferase involved in cell wall biosynthesis